MERKNVSTKVLSAILSVIMVLTMIPATALTSVAADSVEATAPIVEGGGWEHQKDSDGKGINYVSMSVNKTEFTFIQTKDNERLRYDFNFSAMKNDGTNSATINGVTVTHVGYSLANADVNMVWSQV